jgi:hypothetical protein
VRSTSMTTCSSRCGRRAGAVLATALAAAMVSLGTPATVAAQDDPNPGALTFAGSLDVPTLYYFRGIRQETDPSLTLWPVGDLGLALFSGDGAVKSVGVNVGVWNSLHTGTSGSDHPVASRLHYELDYYSTLALGFGGGVTLGTTYTAYTSPNFLFDTVNEIAFKVAQASRYAPYALIAFELDDQGQADLGASKGTYVELGVGPSWPLGGGGPTLTVPVKLGLSLSDYYENPLTGEDEKFGFFDVGALVTLPLTGIPSRFGSWNIHGGADLLFFGDTTEAYNTNRDLESSSNTVVALFGIGVTY